MQKVPLQLSTYHFAGDRLAIHVGGRRSQMLPVPPLVVGYERRHFAIRLLIGEENPFDSSYLQDDKIANNQNKKTYL